MTVPEKLHGFILKDTREYEGCGYTGYLYQNEKFNCPFFYIRTEDTNNFFSVHFRTPAEDNTGISHMLEHLSLNGSQKYPIRNIFFELKKRSYSTYMNAFTSSGYTAFPFGSTNQTDFFNNLDVYLDCVFHPQFSDVDFLSECHHLYFKDNDPNNPLVHGGVVYNEMVGLYSQQQKIFNQKLNEFFYPDNPSRFDSGGSPSDIPKATYESIINHHKRYYHPVNAFFYFYGNTSFPMDQVFQKVSEVIDQFDIIESPYHPELYEMEPWTEPRTVVIDAPGDEKTPLDEQHQVTISFLLNEKSSNYQFLSDVDILIEILGRTNNSPLYKSLVVPGHVKSVYVRSTSEFYPSIKITVTGFLKEKTAEIENMIINIIKEFCEKPLDEIEEERIDCYYHKLKLINKQFFQNFGLSLFHSCASKWIYGGNPLDLINFNTNLERCYNNCKQKGYLKSLAKRIFLDNKHCLFARLNPVLGYNEKKIEEEKMRLEEVKKNLTQTEIQQILDNMKRISEEKNKEQPLHLLPQIHRCDISKDKIFKSVDDVINDQIYVLINPTNGVTYSRIVVSLEQCDVPDLWLFPILNGIAISVGAGRFNEYEFSMYSQRWVSKLINKIGLSNTVDGKTIITLKIYCNSLDEDIDKASEILKMISTQTHWDNIEKVEIIRNQIKNFIGKIIPNNMDSFNGTMAEATLDEDSSLYEAVVGITGTNKLRDFIMNKTASEIAVACEKLYKSILTNGKITAYVSCGENVKEKAVSMLSDIIETIQKVPKIEYEPFNYSKEIFEKFTNKKTFIDMPVQSGTVSLKKLCVKADQVKISACLSVLKSLLTDEALFTEIRDKNGAYGGQASYGPLCGIFSISTHRDTVPTKNYEAILNVIKNVDSYINDESVERACVSVLSSCDVPKAPPTNGLGNAIAGITLDYCQARRDVYLSASADDVKEAAKLLINGEFNVSIATSSKLIEPPAEFEVIKI